MDIVLIVCISLLLLLGIYLRSRRARRKVIRLIAANCTGCGCCVKRCRHGVLAIRKDAGGVHAAVTYPRKCTACGKCLAVCRFDALELAGRKGSEERAGG